jgi:hypothetical protein
VTGISLLAVPAEFVDRYWPAIDAELQVVAARCAERWTPADVLAEIRSGDATLTIAFDAGDAIGFMVYQIASTSFSKALHIWVAGGGTLERMKEYWPLIRDIGKRKGCDEISFESPRRWGSALKFLEVRYLYREGI